MASQTHREILELIRPTVEVIAMINLNLTSKTTENEKIYTNHSRTRSGGMCQSVTLVARELLKAIPRFNLQTVTPQSSEWLFHVYDICFDVIIHRLSSMNGRARYFGVQRRILIVRYISAATGLSALTFDEVELPHIDESDIVYETCRSGGKGDRMSTK